MVLVDTNILAYLMIEGDRTSAAQELYARDPDWCSEVFVLVELSNILATCIRTKAMTREAGTRLLAEAQTLVPSLTSVAHAQALENAMQFEISAYDARFIALARQTRAKLVTEDARLRSAVPDWTISLAKAVG
jgi:predicted nucleic acid-binding protein